MKKIDNLVRKTRRILSIFLCSGLLALTANAQTPADSPCDPNYYGSLKSRAWLEAQREITQNQNLIFKPDSVLEYTCFDRYLNVLAKQAENMFSENQDRWGKPVLPPDSMDIALDKLVGAAVRPYIAANFGHDLLGDRATGLNYEPGPEVAGGSYECGIMNEVWMRAKCLDFISDKEHDGFFTFAEYQSGSDKRFLPRECSAINDRWKAEYETALVTEATPWEEDTVITRFEWLDPLTCVSGAYPGIETGLTIKRSQPPEQYIEKICLQPGCFYDPAAGGGGECRETVDTIHD